MLSIAHDQQFQTGPHSPPSEPPHILDYSTTAEQPPEAAFAAKIARTNSDLPKNLIGGTDFFSADVKASELVLDVTSWQRRRTFFPLTIFRLVIFVSWLRNSNVVSHRYRSQQPKSRVEDARNIGLLILES